MSLSEYIIGLYRDVPSEVYEALLSILCIGMSAALTIKGLKKSWRIIGRLLFVEYLFLIYCTTVLYRTYKENIGYNYTPFWSYEAIKGGREDLLCENILNIVAFVPFVILLGSVSRRVSWWMALLIGLGISISIEALQFLLKRGFCEFDDVFHNTFGCLIGIIILSIIKRIWKFCSFLFIP